MAPKRDSEMPSVSELIAQKVELERQIAEAQRAEHADAVARVRALMAEHGLTVADITAKSAAGARRATSKVAPKYRNQATGDTWSGRGLQPNWLRTELAAGRRLEEFAV